MHTCTWLVLNVRDLLSRSLLEINAHRALSSSSLLLLLLHSSLMAAHERMGGARVSKGEDSVKAPRMASDKSEKVNQGTSNTIPY